jgi:hypothetical protein
MFLGLGQQVSCNKKETIITVVCGLRDAGGGPQLAVHLSRGTLHIWSENNVLAGTLNRVAKVLCYLLS